MLIEKRDGYCHLDMEMILVEHREVRYDNIMEISVYVDVIQKSTSPMCSTSHTLFVAMSAHQLKEGC